MMWYLFLILGIMIVLMAWPMFSKEPYLEDDKFYALLIPAGPVERIKITWKYRKYDAFCFFATPVLMILFILQLWGVL